MKKIALLITLALFIPVVSATVTFTLEPATQTVNPGDTVTLALNLANDESIWGFSFKLDEMPPSDITFIQGTPNTRLNGGLNGAVINTVDRTTLYSVFSANTPGIAPGTGPIYSLEYNVPGDQSPGTIDLTPLELVVSDSQGGTLEATILGSAIIVEEPQEPPEEPEDPPEEPEDPPETGIIGFHLPDVTGAVDSTVTVPLCVTNTYTQNPVTSIDVTFTHDPALVYVDSVDIAQGQGTYTTDSGATSISLTGLNILNANCDEETGAHVASITYYLSKMGTTSLSFIESVATDQSSAPFSIQALNNKNGFIGVGVDDVTKSCEPIPGIVTKGSSFLIRYKLTNPYTTFDIGGIDETDGYDNTAFGLGTITNLVPGSLLETDTSVPGSIRTVISTPTLPLLFGPATHDVYDVQFTTDGTTPIGPYTFTIMPGPPTGHEVSDEQHQDVTGDVRDCGITIITSCTTDEDCDDDNVCNGIETCVQGACIPGDPLNCNDDNPDTFDSCDPEDGCIKKRPRRSSGGGGGGGSTRFEEISLCETCPQFFDGIEYLCCGLTYPQINSMCENANMHPEGCQPVEPTIGEPTTGMPAFPPTIEQPTEQEVVQQPVQRTRPQPVQRKAPQRQAPVQQTNDSGMFYWFAFIFLVLVVGLAFIAARTKKHSAPLGPLPPIASEPEEPPLVPEDHLDAPDMPEYRPVIKPEMPIPIIIPKPVAKPTPKRITPEPIKPTTTWVPPKKTKQSNVASLEEYKKRVKKRLAKAKKKR